MLNACKLGSAEKNYLQHPCVVLHVKNTAGKMSKYTVIDSMLLFFYERQTYKSGWWFQPL